MDRREFGVKAAGAFALASLAACESTGADLSPGRRITTAEFDKMLKKFERILWETVEYGARTVEPKIRFWSRRGCRKKYKEGHVPWYEKMKGNLQRDYPAAGDPTDSIETDFKHYFDNYYLCCTLVGRKAARLAAEDGTRRIDTNDHFEEAMCHVNSACNKRKAKMEKAGDKTNRITAGMCG